MWNLKRKGKRTMGAIMSVVMASMLLIGNTGAAYAVDSLSRFETEPESLTDGSKYSVATVSNAKFKNEEKQGMVISVFSEDSDFRAGGDVVLDVHIKNDTGSVISGGSLWARAKGSETGSAYFEEVEDSVVYADDIMEVLNDDLTDIEMEPDTDFEKREGESGKITGIELAPGGIYSARYHFVVAENQEKAKNQEIKFYFTGKNEDGAEIYENENFLYTVNYLNLDTVQFENGNRVNTGEEVTMGIHSFMYDFDALLWDSFVDTGATPSDATPSDATPSDATPANAVYPYDKDSDSYVVDLEDTSYTIQMVNAKLNDFKVRKALVNDANENMLVCSYRVSKNVEPGIYFGKVTQESKSKSKTLRSTQGFALIVEGDGEITLQGQASSTMVTVSGPANSFPDADQLALRVAGIGSDVQGLAEAALQKRADEEGFIVNNCQMLDIQLYADGEEAEPEGSLQVVFRDESEGKKGFLEKTAETVAEVTTDAVKSVLEFFSLSGGDGFGTPDVTDSSIQRKIYHYDIYADTITEVASKEISDKDIFIETDDLSVYLVADITMNDTILTAADDDGIIITMKGNLPVSADLKIIPMTKQERDSMAERLEKDGIKLEGIWSFGYDIGIGGQNSFEQPSTITVSNFNLGYYNYDNLRVNVYYIHDGNVIMENAEINKDGITFQSDGSSEYYFDIDVIEDKEKVINSIAEPGPEILQYLYPEQYTEASMENNRMNSASISPKRTSLVMSGSSELSDSQVVNEGGISTNNDGVTISKMIDGTDIENVFDITLKVTTSTSISELLSEPDMAVILVMDISNTMRQTMGTSSYASGTGISSDSRYTATIEAAENFLDTFAENTSGTSQVGFVAFNTSATEIFPLSSCSNETEAANLKTAMASGTEAILGASNYSSSRTRFTNMEAGLKMARDMLTDASNQNKYIVFMTDGMPTTYVKSGYTGYEPFSSSGTVGTDGVFYDNATGYYCSSGTSYSDKAAIRAREMATSIKEQDITIFSIGADVGTNTVKGYDGRTALSVIDRTCSSADKTKDSSYEVGSYADQSAFANWLEGTADGADSTGIGSGYYYAATDKEGLEIAYADIFEKIQEINTANAEKQWVATDPMSTVTSEGIISPVIEFLGICDKYETYLPYEPTSSLSGKDGEGEENTAEYDSSTYSISWDLK